MKLALCLITYTFILEKEREKDKEKKKSFLLHSVQLLFFQENSFHVFYITQAKLAPKAKKNSLWQGIHSSPLLESFLLLSRLYLTSFFFGTLSCFACFDVFILLALLMAKLYFFSLADQAFVMQSAISTASPWRLWGWAGSYCSELTFTFKCYTYRFRSTRKVLTWNGARLHIIL